MWTRRRAVSLLAAGTALPLVLPGVALAAAPTDRRLVVVLLRGALDGLAAVPPWRDAKYAEVRQGLALDPPGSGDGVLDLDGYFGLHPALAPVHAHYAKGDLAVFQAVAGPYRDRSHFDAQDLMENGTTRPRGAADGWLNRALGTLPGGGHRLGLAVGQQVPLLLRGDVGVASWAPRNLPDAPPDFLTKLGLLWAGDPLFAPALAEGMRAQAMSDEVLGPAQPGAPRRGPALAALGEPVGKLLAAAGGPRIAVLEAYGWDTHSQQGKLTGRLATALEQLAGALDGLARGLGPAWDRTAIVAITEFGRTVAPNGTNGTDHGTATCAFLLGGAVKGGRVLADWPGLAPQNLYEGRDLRPTVDVRQILKGVLHDHMGVEIAALDRLVFPDSAGARPLSGLIRT